MTLGEFRDYINSFPNDKVFPYSLSEPFSWRGIYAEVAFDIVKKPSSKMAVLGRIHHALTGTFVGYKGGDYTYNEHTEINFESSISKWTDGGYCQELIRSITKQPIYPTLEHHLVKVAFN